MSYTPNKVLLPTGFDEFGLKLSLNRLEGESLDNYRRRLLLETCSPSGSSFENFSQAVSRKVGLFDYPALRFDLVLDGDGAPVAADPAIVITATRLLLYRDYENQTLELEFSLLDKYNGAFLQDIIDGVSGNAYFTATLLDDSLAMKPSKQLQVGTNLISLEIPRLSNREVHDFNIPYIRDILFNDALLFRKEVNAVGDISEYGEYYIDRLAGVVFTYSSMLGGCTIEYAKFPFDVNWQSVRTYEFKDDDVKYLIYDNLRDVDGTNEPLLLNSTGARMINELLLAHPLEWGE